MSIFSALLQRENHPHPSAWLRRLRTGANGELEGTSLKRRNLHENAQAPTSRAYTVLGNSYENKRMRFAG